MAEDQYRTDDMCLVAVLCYEGHTAQRVVWEGGRDGKCYWHFDRIGNVVEIIESYFARAIRVEPREFNHTFGEVKKEFYRLLDKAKRG